MQRRSNSSELALDPAALDRFGRLELLARLIVEGVMSGLHKSPFKGFSVEFAEHRHYGPGDEIRHIDWRAFGKTDRFFVKEFEEETNLKAYLVVDTSGSMAYAGRTISKLDYARQLAAAFAYMMISQRDAVGLVTFDSALRAMIPARSAPSHFSVLCKSLAETIPGGERPLSGILHGLAETIKRRGMVMIFSDGFDKLDDLTSALKHLRHRRHEVVLFHVLAPEEEEFPFRGQTQFKNLENANHRQLVDPAAMRKSYLEKFGAFRTGLIEAIRAMGADYHRASCAVAHDATILDYLAMRTGRGRSQPSAERGGAR